MKNEQEKNKAQRGRRKVLGAAIGLAGGLVGVATGVSLGGARSTAALRRLGVRRFENKVVCITGATSGIGGKTAHAG